MSTEGLFYSVLRVTDVLQLLQLTPKETLNLRRVSHASRNIIDHSERFWKRAFPGIESFDSRNLYSEAVIERCRSRHLVRLLDHVRAEASCYTREKSAVRQKIERRRAKIAALQREVRQFEDQLVLYEKRHKEYSDRAVAIREELKRQGIKRPAVKTLVQDTAFKRQNWVELE